MAKIQQIFQDETRRLAKKEIKLSITPLSKQIAALKKQITGLEKVIRAALPTAKQSAKAADAAAPETEKTAKKCHVTKAGILRLRKKLNLSQADFAVAIGVSPLTVCHWEQGKTKPRESQKQAIANLRTMGKRAIVKLIAAAKPAKPAAKEIKQETAPATAPVEEKKAE